MATYTVIADRLATADKDGNRTRYYRGDKISGLSQADVERFTRAGAIAATSDEVAKDAVEHPADVPHGESSWPDDTDDTSLPLASDIVAQQNSGIPQVKKPAKAGTKEAWAEYAVLSGQKTAEEAGAMTRDQLRDELD